MQSTSTFHLRQANPAKAKRPLAARARHSARVKASDKPVRAHLSCLDSSPLCRRVVGDMRLSIMSSAGVGHAAAHAGVDNQSHLSRANARECLLD